MSYQVDSYGNAYFPAGVSVASIPATTGAQNKVLVPGPDGRISSASISQLITQSGGNLVSSVYGRTGAVVARQGDYNTDQVTEGQALYFTDSRARKALSVTTFNTSGPATYDSTTGIINIPQYGSGIVGNYVPVTRTITINGQTADLSADRIFSIDSMVYPSAGIPLSNGTSWGTSIVNNSANWNTAYGWGDHAGLYSLLGHTHTFASLTSIPTTLAGYGITDAATSAQGTKADTAFSWGNHALAGYLTSFTETDPIYTASTWYTTTNNATNWNTAYTWGNHALAGYLTSFTETDPIWTSEKINYYTKLQADARYLQSYTETDPVWTSEKVNYYTKTAADARYLQSYTETDPVWTSEKANYALKTYVDTSISNLVDSAPGTLNTLNELAAALGDDANFSTTITTLIGTKEPAITAGTTAQYWRGDKSWQTLPVYTLSGLGGVPTTRTLTINGTSYDLSADRSWSITSMIYPSAGIAVSTGSAWGTSITDNSSNWNTAYSWGNHASVGYLTGITSSQVTNALGYTPYNSSNPNGYISSYSETDPVYTSERDALLLNKMVHSTQLWSTLADYNRPSGYSAMIQPASYQNPVGTHGFFHVIARRDAGNGYGALLQAYNSGEIYHGNTTESTTNITWYRIWNSSNFNPSNYYLASNPSGYISSYTETDTLATVTSRGASTSSAVTVSNNFTANDLRITTGYLRSDNHIYNLTLSGSAQNVWAKRILISESYYGNEGLIPYGSGLGKNTLWVHDFTASRKHGAVISCDNNGEAHIYAVDYANTSGDPGQVGSAGGWGWNMYYDGLGDEFFRMRIGEGGTWTEVLTIDRNENVRWKNTTGFTINGNAVWHSGNFTPGSYLPLSGGTLSDVLYFTDTTNGIYKSGGRLTIRSESTDNVANFANYGLYLPITGQTAGLYVESPIEARGGLRIGSGAGNGTITVGADTAATANRLVQRDAGGDIYSRYSFAVHFNASCPNNENPSIAAIWTNSSTDNYLRKSTPAHLISQLSLVTNSGTWGISISGNAATASNSSALNGISVTQIFNNMGNNHGTYTDFNSVGGFGVRYIQGSTNGPGTGASQYYGFTLGLGNEYPYSGGGSYGTQFYWNRTSTGGNPYVSVRFNENNSWGAWSKIWAGYADSAGAVAWTNVSGRPTNVSSFTNDSGYVTSSGSVNYSNYSGYADRIQTGNNQWVWSNGAHTVTNPNTVTLWDQYSNYGGSGNPTAYGTILDIYGRSAHEHDQLYFSYDGQLLHRNCFYGTNSWSGWRTILNDSQHGYAARMNQDVRTTDNVTFNRLTATHAIFTNDPSSRVMYLRGSGNIIQFQDASANNKWEVVGRDGQFYVYKNDGSGSGMRWQINASGDHSISGYVTLGSGISTPYSLNATTYNQPGLLLNASGTSSSGAAFGMQQVTGEGWTGIFVDYEPYTGWGLYHDNPNNYFCVTAEGTTGQLRSFTVPSRSSGNRTAYEKIRFDQNNGSILAGGDITAFSDARSKENIEVISNAVNKVQAIRGVTYTKVDSEGDAKNIRHAGVLAQEVLEVLPEVVHQDQNTGMYSVAYGNLVALLIEGMKEQQAQIEELKNEIKELKNK